MNLKRITVCLCAVLFAPIVLGQSPWVTNYAGRLVVPWLDFDSQSNIVVTIIEPDGPGRPCPPKYANSLSNTNLFTLEEQKVINEVRVKYKNVTTNSGPPGAVLSGLYQTNYSTPYGSGKEWVACFRYTNSEASDEILFFPGSKYASNEAKTYQALLVKHETKSGYRYDADISGPDDRGISSLQFDEYQNGMRNGLSVGFQGADCRSLMRFSNGMAVGQWLMWGDGKLILQAEFKTSYDFEKHSHLPEIGAN